MTPRETPIRVTITRGNLADELHQAERRLLDMRAKLEELLESLYPAGFTSFDSYDATLDVFGVLGSTAAVDALHRAGWVHVYEHDHAAAEFRRCACRVR